jgi:hypothetical protein
MLKGILDNSFVHQLSPDLKSFRDAQQTAGGYPKEKLVEVYYNPDKHEQADLVPCGSEFNIVPHIFTIVLALLWKFGVMRFHKCFHKLGKKDVSGLFPPYLSGLY